MIVSRWARRGALVPSLCNAAAIALAYPISRDRHREILHPLGRAAPAAAT